MSNSDSVSRRAFLSSTAVGAAALAATAMDGSPLARAAHAAERSRPLGARAAKYPIGIELYAVRTELARDLPATLRAVKEIGYEVVEFYAPYLGWTIPFAKQVRTQLDDLGLRCYSTHNPSTALLGDAMPKAIELNQVLGARHIIMASPPPRTTSAEDWKAVSGRLAEASKQLEPHGLMAGFHNHRIEWLPAAGGQQRVMDILAENTPKEFVLQFDVGTCLEAGQDPVAWIKAHPGRIRSLHLKDWAPGDEKQEKGYRVLFGEGVAPWKQILDAAESVGGVEFYLMEQEGSRYSELDTARRCLESWKRLRAGA